MLTTIILCTLAASIFNGLFYFLVSFFLLKRIKNLIKKDWNKNYYIIFR